MTPTLRCWGRPVPSYQAYKARSIRWRAGGGAFSLRRIKRGASAGARAGGGTLYQAYIARGIRWHVGGAALYKVYLARSIRWRAGGGGPYLKRMWHEARAIYAEYCTEDLPPRPVAISGANFCCGTRCSNCAPEMATGHGKGSSVLYQAYIARSVR